MVQLVHRDPYWQLLHLVFHDVGATIDHQPSPQISISITMEIPCLQVYQHVH